MNDRHRTGSLSEYVAKCFNSGKNPNKFQEENEGLKIKSTISPEKAEAFLGNHFGAVIIADLEGDSKKDMILIVHPDEQPPTEECLVKFGTSLLSSAAKRRIKKFMVIAGPYNPEPKRHRKAIPSLYEGVSEMMERRSIDEPNFKGIVVPTSEKYIPMARSSAMLFNVNAKRIAFQHRLRQVVSGDEKFLNQVSFTSSQPMTPDDKTTALQEALHELGLTDLATLIRVKRYYNKIINRTPKIKDIAYLLEQDLDRII